MKAYKPTIGLEVPAFASSSAQGYGRSKKASADAKALADKSVGRHA